MVHASLKHLLLVSMTMICLAFDHTVAAFRPPVLARPTTTITTSNNKVSLVQTYLHPSQAADLEAVAYDLMKEALEEQRKKQEFNFQNPVEANSMRALPGPVAWCRRRLWPFSSRSKQNLRP